MSIIDFPEPLAFEWDKGNQDKSRAKHGVSNIECESAFTSDILFLFHDAKHSIYEDRYVLISRVSSVPLFIVFTVRDSIIRVISVRRMHKKELQAYEKKSQKNS